MLYIMQSIQKRGKVKTEIIMNVLFNGYKVICIMYMTCIFACRNIVYTYMFICTYMHIMCSHKHLINYEQLNY